jgi:hypothetical protein
MKNHSTALGRLSGQGLGLLGQPSCEATLGASVAHAWATRGRHWSRGWGCWCVGPSATVMGGSGWLKIRIQTEFKSFSNFDWSKNNLSELKKIEMKYGCEGFEERNNILLRNFSRFKTDFKWKFKEFLGWEFNRISSSNFKFGWNLDKKLVFAPSD